VTETAPEDISIFDLAAIVLKSRYRILLWMVIGGALAVIPRLNQQLLYTGLASFVAQTQGSDNATSGLRSLAGQFGLSLGGGGGSQSPQFYVDLVRSPVILGPILADTFNVPEAPVRRATLLDLLGIKPAPKANRLEQGLLVLGRAVAPRFNRETGVITVEVTTAWPSLSAALAARILGGVDSFNLRTRQGQAGEERRFTEGRLAESRASLRAVEDRMQEFLQTNRQWQSSPQLVLSHDRLQRDLDLQQQLVVSLAQSNEEARLREARATPSITVIQEPTVPTLPNPRGRLKRGFFGMLFAGFLAILWILAREMFRGRRAAGDPHLERFLGVLAEIRGDFARLVGRRRRRVTS
jgi:uncharacterized protein involved in exopolysaccharide biosynthesis